MRGEYAMEDGQEGRENEGLGYDRVGWSMKGAEELGQKQGRGREAIQCLGA